MRKYGREERDFVRYTSLTSSKVQAAAVWVLFFALRAEEG